MNAEATIYQSGEITITPARFVVGSKTYAVRGITSVRGIEITPSKLEPIAMIAAAVLLLVAAFGWPIYATYDGVSRSDFAAFWLPSLLLIFVGFLFGFIGFKWLKRLRSTFAIVLTTASGELTAFESKDDCVVGDVLEALNDAIVKS